MPANYQQVVVAPPPNLSEPIGFDQLPDGRRSSRPTAAAACGCTTRPRNSTTVLAQLPVYTPTEDGLYGPAVDNNFATNKWVYLYYSPQTVKDVKFADGTSTR